MHYWLQQWWLTTTLYWYLYKQHQYSLLKFKIVILWYYFNDDTPSLLVLFSCGLLRIPSHWFSFVDHFIQALVPCILIFFSKVHFLLIFYIRVFMFFLLAPCCNGCFQPAIKIKWVFPLLMVMESQRFFAFW